MNTDSDRFELGLTGLRSTALVIAHPGHELRIFGWLSQARPTVQVLTAGDGPGGASRAEESRALLDQMGCAAGAVFAAAGDRRFYQAMLHGETGFFTDLLEALAEGLIDSRADVVVADAAEGYNPTHDLCRALADAAVRLVQARTGRRLASYALPLAEWERAAGADLTRETIRLRLSDELLRRKLAACRGYRGLEAEVERALAAMGEAYFRDELLWPGQAEPFALPSRPDYEKVGEERVRAGAYAQCLRYADHVAPMARAIHQYAGLEAEIA